MRKKPSLSIIKKGFFIGLSAFLFGTGSTIITPQSFASPGFFEYQWDPEPGYRRLKYFQSASEPLERATYYFFLRGKERKDNIIKLTLKLPDYFKAKIKPEKLSLCKVIVGGFTERTRCLENFPALIEVNENQTSIEVFPERPIPRNKDNYAVVMKIFNPRKAGMFQIQALSQSQQPGEVPISTYLGTWNVQVVKDAL
tara:strand:+ start:1162 stop:1755 length:594 start_codon:yes stop_codon:yes gene_type:complete